MQVRRREHVRAVRELLRDNPVVAILGPRQVGKTTLARQVSANWRGEKSVYDLEDEVDRRKLQDPGVALREAKGLVVLDEVQQLPEVFRLLRVLADRRPIRTRFLVLGSASPELLRQSSESLAGRIAFHDLDGLHAREVDKVRGHSLDRLWLRGGFPASYLARNDEASLRWRQDFVRTFLQRDVPALMPGTASAQLERFWRMLAHWHGSLWNASELARSLGTTDQTARRYLDLLTHTFVLRVLQPWHENLGKRQVKAPRVYIGDSGLAHALLGIGTMADLLGHPKVGASWEGFLIGQVVELLGARRDECFFWATHQGAELDFLVVRGKRRIGFEWKRAEAPSVTKSMQIAMQDLRLDALYVVHGGQECWQMGPKMRAVAARRLLQEIEPLARR
jgi:predicted AAA+ superfamily ATPase